MAKIDIPLIAVAWARVDTETGVVENVVVYQSDGREFNTINKRYQAVDEDGNNPHPAIVRAAYDKYERALTANEVPVVTVMDL